MRLARPFLIPLLAATLAACATVPTHPALRQGRLAELIPTRSLFVDPDVTFGYKVSPDGRRVAWIGAHQGRLGVIIRTLEGGEVTAIATGRPVSRFVWTHDSRRILYEQDSGGDENFHVHVADAVRPEVAVVDLTPHPGVRAYIQQVVRTEPGHVVIAHNGRDRSVFDLYRVHLSTRLETPVAVNPGDVATWLTSRAGGVRGRVRHPSQTERVLEVVDGSAGWRAVARWTVADSVRILGSTLDGRHMWLLSNRGRDRVALVRLDLATGDETVVRDHPDVDISNALISDRTREPLLVHAVPGYPEMTVVDAMLEADLTLIPRTAPAGLSVESLATDEQVLTARVYTEAGSEYWLLDRRTRTVSRLHRAPILRYAEALSPVRPVSFPSRDGLTLHGYLTVPRGTAGKGLPTVLLVHGGPWSRDSWGYNNVVQFLANRGYAVLQVNYRGSTGYGRRFEEAAIGEFAGKMHDDLIDAVQWVVASGTTDPARVAIMGWSYGGYATLVGLTFTPEVFACGVDIVGMSSLVTLLSNAPPYWKMGMARWHRYVGDPDRPEDRARMEEKSPLSRADKVVRPLLIVHGANDARVTLRESEQMVAALRKAGKPVDYLVFSDEGHRNRYGNWRNVLTLFRTIEEFLARHLGGRSGGLDLYEMGTPISR